MSILRRIAQRRETPDRSSYVRTRQLEAELGLEPSEPPDSIVEQYADPALIDCGNRWCKQRR
jgi:hypothetical protein